MSVYLTPTQQAEQAAPIVVDEKIARELIDDFGFTSLAPGLAPASLAAPLEALSLVADDSAPEVDPFDTSFIDIEAIKSGAALPQKPTELIQNLDFTEAEFDPFDTSHIAPEVAVSKKEEEEDVKVNIGELWLFQKLKYFCFSNRSNNFTFIASSKHTQTHPSFITKFNFIITTTIMSNPFLVDLDDNYTPYTSGISTPFSGAATPTTKRRNSTNPFEILSPEGDEPPVTFTLDNEALQSAANEINNNNNSSQQPQENVASTIADMTADFYQAITKHDFNFDATINDDVFEEQQSGRGLQDDILGGDDHEEEDEYEEDNNNFEHQLNKPVTTVKTINYDEEESHGGGVSSSSALFDPFETIHDDDGMSSKRSSVEVSGITPLVSTTGTSSSNQTVTELASSLVSANSAKAKELFNSSMASFELLAAGGKPAGKDDDLLGSPMTPTTPPSMEENSAEVGAVAGAAGSAFLTPAPPTTAGMDVYSSNDLSDLSDVSPTTAADVRSAFNMYSGE